MPSIDPVTGETPDGERYNLHAAMAKAVGGTVQPFDVYQGPYVVVGKDIRLWLVSDEAWPGECARVWREDTDTLSAAFPLYSSLAEIEAAEMARSLLCWRDHDGR